MGIRAAPHGIDPQFGAWLLALITLSGGGVLWLRHDHVNILKDFAWQVPLISYSPLLAALIAIVLWRGRGTAGLGVYALAALPAAWSLRRI